MACVLAVLRGETTDLTQWQDAFALAEQESVLPLFVARLREGGTELTGEVLAQCLAAEREAARSSFWWTSELKNILQGFSAAGVAAILLKGPSLAERVYGAAALRMCRDLDLLVRRRDVAAAGGALRRLGFTADRRPDDYHCGWRRGTTMVELHVDVENPLAIDFDIGLAWERAHPIEFAGQPAWVLAPADELLFLCLHGVRHRYERLSHVVDVALALRLLRAQIGPTAYSSGSAYKLKHLVALGHAMARRVDSGAMPPEGFAADVETTARMNALADRLWADLMQRPGMALDWQAQHRFYLELEPSGLRRNAARVRHLRILATRLIEPDFVYAEKYGIKNVGLVWILRQLRLLLRL